MLDPIISEFLKSKITDFLKKKLKKETSEEDKLLFTQQAKEKFFLKNWLVDSSTRAKQLSLTSHPAKFTHPNAKASSIIAQAKPANDGLLRSGNVTTDLDVFGNAAALDVEKFLRLVLEDGQTLLQHIEQKTSTIQKQFALDDNAFNTIQAGFLEIRHSNLQQTSEKLKQVYFPVADDYHLLTVLTASGIVYKLKQKINEIRFSEKNKQLRETLKKAKPDPIKSSLDDIYNLTAVGYGGTKPQNISTLNNQNGGVSLVLSSMPPQLQKRAIHPPKKDFFQNCLWNGLFQTDLKEFHQVLVWRKNNKAIRDKRDDIVINVIKTIQRITEQIRILAPHWSDHQTYDKLPLWQKIWLDQQYQDIRMDKNKNENYTKKAQKIFANWFIDHYKAQIKEHKLLGDDDIDQIKKILKQEKGLFL